MPTTRPDPRAVQAALLVLVFGALACDDDDGGSLGFQENLDIAVCAPDAGPFSLAIDNPYFPLPVGRQLVLDGIDNGTVQHLEITVLDETEDVAGVTTRVMEERESEDGALIEISRNFFAQAQDGTVCYFGEDVDIFEGDSVVSHEGEWRAGVGGAVPGIMMPAAPAEGDAFRQEVAEGVAEDRAIVTAVGDSVTVPAGTFTETVRFLESTPLERGAREVKIFARDVGLVVDATVRLSSYTP